MRKFRKRARSRARARKKTQTPLIKGLTLAKEVILIKAAYQKNTLKNFCLNNSTKPFNMIELGNFKNQRIAAIKPK